jgi:PhnB protein
MSKTMEANTSAGTPVKGGLVAYVNVDGATKAARFYQKAFGATIAAQMPPDDAGRTAHLHLYVNGASLMLSDFYPEHGHTATAPTGFFLTLMVRDIGAAFKRAIDAGCTSVQAPEKMFWGDIYAQLRDPFGVLWAMNQGTA